MNLYQVAYVIFTVKNGIRTDSGMIFTTSETSNTSDIEKMLRIQHANYVEVLAVRKAPAL